MTFRSTIIFIFFIISTHNSTYGQSYKQKLTEIFSSQGPNFLGGGDFSYQTTYSPSGSIWELDWDETHVFKSLFSFNASNNISHSYEMRIGKAGQIYSFKNPVFGEALPPQWRPSYNQNGAKISDQAATTPITSNHGNWAPWNDEVWQLVGSDQKDSIAGVAKTQNIHMAGSYMNNYAHRASDHTVKPFYSPMVQSYYNSTEQSLSTITWGQSEDPTYVYDAPEGCDVCFNDVFRPSVLFFQRYKNLGDGVIQVDFLIYNYHRTRGIDFWNVPFTGIRNSTLPYGIISNSNTDETSYEILNTKIGHPLVDDPSTREDESAGYLPLFNQGVRKATSGNSSQSSGWMAFSSDSNGNGPCLAFVTAKSASNPANAYGDLRYGTAMSDAIRDVTIFSRRAGSGSFNPITGMRAWGIVGGQSIEGRYFIVLESNINNILQQIQSKNLVTEASIEIIDIANETSNNIYYIFSNTGAHIYTASETSNPSLADFSFNSKPFNGSYPVFLISTDSNSVLSSDPYIFSLRPYDNTIVSTELLGYSSTMIYYDFSTFSNKDYKKNSFIIYPNPINDLVTCLGKDLCKKNIRILNILGQNVSNTTTIRYFEKDKITIDMSKLNTGLYFIEIEKTMATKVYKK